LGMIDQDLAMRVMVFDSGFALKSPRRTMGCLRD
jgi:hypothetical protein